MALGSLFRLVDRIVVITVPRATERQDRMTRLLAEVELPFEFHFGFDSREATTEQLEEEGLYSGKAREAQGRSAMTPAEIGCAISHRDVATKIAKGADERVLILEDDVCFRTENLAIFEESVSAIPRGWNLAYLGYAPMNLFIPIAVRIKLWTYYPLAYALGSNRHNPRTIARIYRRGLGRFWKKAGWFNNAHAYAIDKAAATYISEAQKNVSLEADVVLNQLVRFSGLNAICLKHPIVDQSSDVASLIGDRPSWRK
jgi:GR25 family glycosyltransferase involved in LPS biosynthesis